jgi:tRNA-splicing ligase RtcB
MGTSSFIVKGLGNTGSYTSAPHGAGRRMGRKAAERAFSYRDLEDRMQGIEWNLKDAGQLVDEIPDSYKDIHTVIADSAELVEVHFELSQILNYKGA